MAQCVAAHVGLRALAKGEPVRAGLLIGARRVDFHVDGFQRGQVLLVDTSRVWGDREMGAFACAVRERATAGLLVEGTLSVVLPESLDALRAGRHRS
jgi:predicted hotdog family 3-hydroxylacyl-ACP dehydratase